MSARPSLSVVYNTAGRKLKETLMANESPPPHLLRVHQQQSRSVERAQPWVKETKEMPVRLK